MPRYIAHSLLFLSPLQSILHTLHQDLLGPVVPRPHYLQPFDQQARTDLHASVLEDRHKFLLGEDLNSAMTVLVFGC